MEWSDRHTHRADHSFDGGDLDCGNGLLLLLRRHLDPLLPGQLLEILSTEISVDEDLPAWARLTGNELVSRVRQGNQRSFLVCKGIFQATRTPTVLTPPLFQQPRTHSGNRQGEISAAPVLGPLISVSLPPLAVVGIGSWPRPRWMLEAIHGFLEGRLGEGEFHSTADDAVRLAVAAQERAGCDLVTDGEQRRDNYASFVGTRLDNVQLIPITDLLPYVEDPAHFEAELRSLDVPAAKVRHPAVLGPLRRTRALAVHELQFAQGLTRRPVKVALPGPYLLTRTMWLECVSDRFYQEREALARDVVRVLREEVQELLSAGAALVQLDEPVLTEVVYGAARGKRSFMCGALGERRGAEEELAFASKLLQETLAGLPRERLALHVCRGNWSVDERVALRGDYAPLMGFFQTAPVGTFFLEACTPRAGDLEVLRGLPKTCRIGLGVVDQKSARIETPEEIRPRVQQIMELFGPDRLFLTPDCGFATFADSPIAAAQVAEAKLAAVAEVARQLRS